MAWGGDWHQPRSGPGHVTSLGPASWGHGTGGIICVSRCHTGGGGESQHSHCNSLTDMAWATWASAHTQPLVSVISWPHMVHGALSWPQSPPHMCLYPGHKAGWGQQAGVRCSEPEWQLAESECQVLTRCHQLSLSLRRLSQGSLGRAGPASVHRGRSPWPGLAAPATANYNTKINKNHWDSEPAHSLLHSLPASWLASLCSHELQESNAASFMFRCPHCFE